METILTKIAEQSPMVGLLIAIVWYFIKQIEKKDKRIEVLSQFILDEQKEFSEVLRDNQREIIKTVTDVTDSLKSIKHFLKYEKRE